MKKLKKWLNDIFDVETSFNIDIYQVGESLGDTSVRTIWLTMCLDEIKRIHVDIDKRLLYGESKNISDLCARRQAFQDMLLMILSARKTVKQEVRHNPKGEMIIDLDRVTA